MKNYYTKKILTTLLLILPLIGYGQGLTFIDLKYLLEHDIEMSETYISTKGFTFYSTEKGENDWCETMTWAFDRNTYDNKAKSFVAKYCYDANDGFVWYQLGHKETFDKMKTYCKSIGFKLTETENRPYGDLCFSYENSKFKIQFCSGIDKNDNNNVYTITLKNK